MQKLKSVGAMLLPGALVRGGSTAQAQTDSGKLAEAVPGEQVQLPAAWVAAQQAGGADVLRTLSDAAAALSALKDGRAPLKVLLA